MCLPWVASLLHLSLVRVSTQAPFDLREVDNQWKCSDWYKWEVKLPSLCQKWLAPGKYSLHLELWGRHSLTISNKVKRELVAWRNYAEKMISKFG